MIPARKAQTIKPRIRIYICLALQRSGTTLPAVRESGNYSILEDATPQAHFFAKSIFTGFV